MGPASTQNSCRRQPQQTFRAPQPYPSISGFETHRFENDSDILTGILDDDVISIMGFLSDHLSIPLICSVGALPEPDDAYLLSSAANRSTSLSLSYPTEEVGFSGDSSRNHVGEISLVSGFEDLPQERPSEFENASVFLEALFRFVSTFFEHKSVLSSLN